jgi:hypothetical protein
LTGNYHHALLKLKLEMESSQPRSVWVGVEGKSRMAAPVLWMQVIKVRLLSDLLGPFEESFKWTIKGSSMPLVLQFKGNVCGPSFEVDSDVLDFGVVSYGFRWVPAVG